ncbi:MAG: SDR family oxidoreductase [bacterium]|nr:SDR family oxidoreductase [bacterium]
MDLENSKLLENKNIIVTGASSGIGRECAVKASKCGAKVIIIARREDELNEVFEQLHGSSHLQFVQDITKYDQMENIIEQSVEKTGKISGFVHSAGIEMTRPLKSLTEKHYQQVFAVNVIAAFEIAKLVSKKKYLDEQGSSFVFISSIMSFLGQSGKIGYCASKGALNAGAKAMALELVSKKVRVNTILPAFVETEMSKNLLAGLPESSKDMIENMHPLGFGKADDVANSSVFLLSDMSRWITGTNLVVDGGYSAK